MIPPRHLLFLLIVIAFSACKRSSDVEVKDDFRKYYRQNQLEGCFAMYDLKKDRYIFCNKPQAEQSFVPSSTFKICNTLIALETGVAKDGNSTLKIDTLDKTDTSEEAAHPNIKSAFQSSTIGYYYQELARRIGKERMKYWLAKLNTAIRIWVVVSTSFGLREVCAFPRYSRLIF